MTEKVYLKKEDVSKIYGFICLCIFENINTPEDYNSNGINEGLMDKLTFNLSKTQPVILTQVMIILNNLSRYHLSDITFLIEKFHIGMIVWLIINLLD